MNWALFRCYIHMFIKALNGIFFFTNKPEGFHVFNRVRATLNVSIKKINLHLLLKIIFDLL